MIEKGPSFSLSQIGRSAAIAAALLFSTHALAEALPMYIVAVHEQLPPPAREAVKSIDSEPRRLLATRAYLRADDSLEARWSWTEAKIAEYERSDDYRALLDAIDQVRARFESRNPGYSLFVNTEVRSLDLQLQRWNKNPGVAQAARQFYADARDELRQGNYPERPDTQALQRFVTFLRNRPTSIPVPLAAPGLSLHGQSRALDFQVRKGDMTVAGAEVASVTNVWEKQGWARKLRAAVDPGQGVFVGPLAAPNEPWHYEYVR